MDLGDYDSAIYNSDKYISLCVNNHPKGLVHAYARKIKIYIQFNKLADTYHMALEMEKKYCNERTELCSKCDEIYAELS